MPRKDSSITEDLMPKRFVVVPIPKSKFIHNDKATAVAAAKDLITRNQKLTNLTSSDTTYVVAEMFCIAFPKKAEIEIEVKPAH